MHREESVINSSFGTFISENVWGSCLNYRGSVSFSWEDAYKKDNLESYFPQCTSGTGACREI